jgi:hypothetical protein
MSGEKTKLSIAYHEAGHAVVGLRLGFEVRCAYVGREPDTKRRGHVFEGHLHGYVRPGKDTEPRGNRLVRRIMFGQAGEIAERLSPDPFHKDEELPAWWKSLDERHAIRDALKLCKGDRAKANELLARLYRETEELVLQNRDAIGRVAIELEKHDRLTGEDIRDIDARRWQTPELEEIEYTESLRELYWATAELPRRLPT